MAEPLDDLIASAEAFANAKIGDMLPEGTRVKYESEPLAPSIVMPPDSTSLFDLHKQFLGVDPAAELPTSLDAHRAAKSDDGYAHCARCGGTEFHASVRFTTSGDPDRILAPQHCIGCGTLRQADWPS